MGSVWTCTIGLACAFNEHSLTFSLSPCGHVFCAPCLVSWFSVALEVGDGRDEERRVGKIRRKKVCPSCRAQVVSPPLELWALKGVLFALRSHLGLEVEERVIGQPLWEGRSF